MLKIKMKLNFVYNKIYLCIKYFYKKSTIFKILNYFVLNPIRKQLKIISLVIVT